MPISFQLFSMSALGHMLNGSAFIRLPMAMVVPRAFGPIVLLYATGFHRLSDCARDLMIAMEMLEPKRCWVIGDPLLLFFVGCWMSF
jgi:hypothetical protein